MVGRSTGRSGRCGRSAGVVVRSGRSVVAVGTRGRRALRCGGPAVAQNRLGTRAPLAMASRSDRSARPAGSVVRLAALDLAPEVLHFKRPELLTNGFRHDGRPLIHRQPGLLDKRKPLGRARQILRRRRLRLTLQLPDLVARRARCRARQPAASPRSREPGTAAPGSTSRAIRSADSRFCTI